MDDANKLFYGLELEIVKVILINAILNSLLVFSILYFITSLIEISIIYPSILTAGYFFLYFTVNLKKIDYKEIEDNNPDIKELLSTAFDNRGENNLMALALFQDLKGKMQKVHTSNFLSLNRIIWKIAFIFLITLSMVTISSFRVDFGDFKFDLPDIALLADDNSEIRLEYEPGDPSDIFGDPEIAKLGNEELDLELNTIMNEIDFEKEGEMDVHDFTQLEETDDPIYASREENYEGDKSLDEHKDVVKNYFDDIKDKK